MFFTRHQTYDYVLPFKRMVATKDKFEFYKLKKSFTSLEQEIAAKEI